MRRFALILALALSCGDSSADLFKRPPLQVISEKGAGQPDKLNKVLLVISIHDSILKPILVEKQIMDAFTNGGIIIRSVVRDVFEESDPVKAALEESKPGHVITIKQTSVSKNSMGLGPSVSHYTIFVSIYDTKKHDVVWRATIVFRSRGHFMSEEDYHKVVAIEFCDALLGKLAEDGYTQKAFTAR